jgi:hypothetical protein
VVNNILLGGGPFQGRRVVQMPAHYPDPLLAEHGRLRRGAGQCGDVRPFSPERLDQMAPDKAGGAGHQSPHSLRSYSR